MRELMVVRKKSGWALMLGNTVLGVAKTEVKAQSILKILDAEFDNRLAAGYDDGHRDGYEEGCVAGFDEDYGY
jgi:hypothetical protein